LISNEKVYRKTKIMEQLCRSICSAGESFDIKQISNKHGLSERYVQRLFLDLVGLTPRSFFNIRRFNRSVDLVLSSNVSLTSIAYECGYHDQAHFIKEFRKYTGVTPSQARPSLSLGLEFQQAVNIGL
jgi:AraC-like DNA-binding protein